jgi:hypothetical protein
MHVISVLVAFFIKSKRFLAFTSGLNDLLKNNSSYELNTVSLTYFSFENVRTKMFLMEA